MGKEKQEERKGSERWEVKDDGNALNTCRNLSDGAAAAAAAAAADVGTLRTWPVDVQIGFPPVFHAVNIQVFKATTNVSSRMPSSLPHRDHCPESITFSVNHGSSRNVSCAEAEKGPVSPTWMARTRMLCVRRAVSLGSTWRLLGSLSLLLRPLPSGENNAALHLCCSTRWNSLSDSLFCHL